MIFESLMHYWDLGNIEMHELSNLESFIGERRPRFKSWFTLREKRLQIMFFLASERARYGYWW
jgi:hypothetical protein